MFLITGEGAIGILYTLTNFFHNDTDYENHSSLMYLDLYQINK